MRVLRQVSAANAILPIGLRGHVETNGYSKYALRDLHESIALIDRKIAHCRNLERFETQESREYALRKLSLKRASLVKTALALTDPGVKRDPGFPSLSVLHLVESEGRPVLPKEGENGEIRRTPRKRR